MGGKQHFTKKNSKNKFLKDFLIFKIVFLVKFFLDLYRPLTFCYREGGGPHQGSHIRAKIEKPVDLFFGNITPSQNRLNRKFGTLRGGEPIGSLPPLRYVIIFFLRTPRKNFFCHENIYKFVVQKCKNFFSRCFLPPSQGIKNRMGQKFLQKTTNFRKIECNFFL